MDKKETILLDARLTTVIDKHAFNAELSNGHRLVAFFRDKSRCAEPSIIGTTAKVELSPLICQRVGLCHLRRCYEGSSFSKKDV